MLKRIMTVFVGGLIGLTFMIAGVPNGAPVIADVPESEPIETFTYSETTEETTTEEPSTEEEPETETYTIHVDIWTAYEHIPIEAKHQEAIKAACDEVNLSYDLILAIMYVESRYNIDSIGDNGNALGAMQVWPKYWEWIAKQHELDIYSPIGATLTGVYVFAYLLDKNGGDLKCALREYNTGDPFDENGYADLVFAAYKESGSLQGEE